MSKLTTRFKNAITAIITPKPITSKADIRRYYVWVAYTIVCFLFAIIMTISLFLTIEEIDFLIIPLLIWTMLGMGSLLSFFIPVIKSTWKYIVLGFVIGSAFKTEHVSVEHTYGSNYEVKSQTETKSCLFSIIAFFIALYPWSALFAITGPILPIKKMKLMSKEIANYKKGSEKQTEEPASV